MPPKQKITREMLLEHAFKIAEAEGISAVTSRSVANSVGCSVQPVFSQFPTMEDLRQATFDYACDIFVAEVLVNENQPDFFAKTTKWVIDLARYKPNLFRLLYLSSGFKGSNLIEVMMNFESNKRMIAKMTVIYGLEEAVCKDILMRSCLFLVGISTMICVNNMDFSDTEVAEMMKKTVADMVKGAKNQE